MTRTLCTLALLITAAITLFSQTPPPRLFGTSANGGQSNSGAVFSALPEIVAVAALEYSFQGYGPVEANGDLLLASDGKFYSVVYAGGDHNYGAVFSIGQDGGDFSVAHHFDFAEGTNPQCALTEGTDGKLYGTTSGGGNQGQGTVFRMEKDGSSFEVLRHFSMAEGTPSAGITEASNGLLYGATITGGTPGVVYRLAKDGTGFTILHTFDFATECNISYSKLTEGPGGFLYGTCVEGGPGLAGGVYKISLDGSGFQVLKNFSFSVDEGSQPLGSLLIASDGKLYGTTLAGGAEFKGTIFSLNTNGSGFTIVHSFIGDEGSLPLVGNRLIVGSEDGLLYGMNFNGGLYGGGTLYKIGTDGSGFAKLLDFDGAIGTGPYSGVTEGTDGALYGLVPSLGPTGFGRIFKLETDGTGYQGLFDFNANNGSGAIPISRLALAGDGWLYGTAQQGGTSGSGTIFRLHPESSAFELVQHLTPATGSNPMAGLLAASDGWLYGTCNTGGSFNRGNIFRLMPGSTSIEPIFDFTGLTFDGASPQAELIEGSNGILYGTTSSGGEFGFGSVFSIGPDDADYTQLFSFDIGETGYSPNQKLFEASDGKLYGVTRFSGDGVISPQGTIFSLNKNGSNFTILHTFDYETEGFPSGPVTEGTDGKLFGNIGAGLPIENGGIYRTDKDGDGFEIIHGFDVVNGTTPQGGLLPDATADWFYGVTRLGGSNDAGTVFRISSGPFSVFEKIADLGGPPSSAFQPAAGLVWVESASLGSERPKLTGLSLAPNPTAAEFRFVFENDFPALKMAKLRISDGQGRQVFQFSGSLGVANHLLQSQSANWAGGLYFVEVEMDGEFFSEQLVLQK